MNFLKWKKTDAQKKSYWSLHRYLKDAMSPYISLKSRYKQDVHMCFYLRRSAVRISNSSPLSDTIRYFVRAYTHNSKITGRIWTFYISNNCSTIGDDYFQS